MNTLPTLPQQFQHVTKYARYRPDLGRRELWPETVNRYRTFFQERTEGLITPRRWDELEAAFLRLDAIGSMRALWTAGPAADKDEVAIYNCSYLTVSRPEAFDEAMYMLMCGVGVGYSVESKYTKRMPEVHRELHPVDDVIIVSDSKIGWARAIRRLIKYLYDGEVPRWDTSRVRPAGAILNTFGGRASGPEPLEQLMSHVVKVFHAARGRRLSTLECHSIMCYIANIVVVGGVRRSAMIALFDEDDYEMLHCKEGNWFETQAHLAMSNNTQVTYGRPPMGKLLETFGSMVAGGFGEPGICNREALQAQAGRWGRRDPSYDYGMNPCGEIILRDRQLCNLSAAVARPDDDLATLKRKYGYAVTLGVVQSSMTNFRWLSPQWRRNCEDERLLGASLDGIPDHPVLNGSVDKDQRDQWLSVLRDHGRRVAEGDAEKLQIAVPAAIGALKPAGNSSFLHGAASPLKAHHASFYLRRTRLDMKDPVYRLLKDAGVPIVPEVGREDHGVVIEWPMRAPDGAKTRHDWSAVDQLELWLAYHEHFCEHKPSVTINYREEEVPDVFKFVAENYDKASGIAFLPDEDHGYVQAPFEEITEAEYYDRLESFPTVVDWVALGEYEREDMTTAARELACMSGVCQIP